MDIQKELMRVARILVPNEQLPQKIGDVDWRDLDRLAKTCAEYLKSNTGVTGIKFVRKFQNKNNLAITAKNQLVSNGRVVCEVEQAWVANNLKYVVEFNAPKGGSYHKSFDELPSLTKIDGVFGNIF